MHVNTFIGLCIGKYHLKKQGLLKTVKNLHIVFNILCIAHQEKMLIVLLLTYYGIGMYDMMYLEMFCSIRL